jgi:hypothetical protein
LFGAKNVKAIESIAERFERNVQRVENLVQHYEVIRISKGRGVEATDRGEDILRAAVVFLHATLEDFLRSMLAWKLPASSPEEIDKIPLLGQTQKTPSKFLLGSLVTFRDKSVEELIRESVHAHLENWASFNDISQITGALRSCGVELSNFDFDSLAGFMARRHNIVHRADSVVSDLGETSLKPIDDASLKDSIAAVRSLFKLTSFEIQKSFYLPQIGISKLISYADALAENGSVSTKEYSAIFDLPRASFYKLKTDLLYVGFGHQDANRKYLVSNREKGETSIKIAQNFCRNHMVYGIVTNDPQLSKGFSQASFLDIVARTCGDGFTSPPNLEFRAKKLLRLFWTTGFIVQRGNNLTLLATPSSAATQVTSPEHITRTRLHGLFFGDSPPLSLVNGLLKLANERVTRNEAHQLIGRNTTRSLLKLGLITADLRPNTKRRINKSTAESLVRAAALQDAVIKFCLEQVSTDNAITGRELGHRVAEEFNCDWIAKSQQRNGIALAGWAHWLLGDASTPKQSVKQQTPKQIANKLLALSPNEFGTLPLVTRYSGPKADQTPGRPMAISKNVFAAVLILLDEHGLTITEIAKRIGVAAATIYRARNKYGG